MSEFNRFNTMRFNLVKRFNTDFKNRCDKIEETTKRKTSNED